MPTTESWLAAKGLTLDEATVRTALQIENPQSLFSLPLEGAFTELDQAAGAPYARAQALAREGDFEKALDLLQGAVALQPLHLPARLLQAQLLGLQQRTAAALDSYGGFLDAFSYRGDLVPPIVYRAFLQSAAATLRQKDASALDLRPSTEDFHLCSLWSSRTCLAVEWAAHWEVLFAEWDSFAVSAYAWDGRRLLATDSGRWTSLAMLTNRYLVVRQKADVFRIFDLATERELADVPLDAALFRALFLPRDRELAATELYRMAHIDAEQLALDGAGLSNAVFRLAREVSSTPLCL
jgi:hypothetical protein